MNHEPAVQLIALLSPPGYTGPTVTNLTPERQESEEAVVSDVPEKAVLPRRPLPLTISALASLALAAGILLDFLLGLVAPQGNARPFTFIGALCSLPVLAIFAAVLWRSVFGRSPHATQAATILYLLVAALFAGAFFLYGFGGVSGGPLTKFALPAAGCGWCLLCAKMSVRWRETLILHYDAACPELPPDARPKRDETDASGK